jgi:alkanesulfonate monooxygenase
MARQIRLNAISMNCVAHLAPGLWTHPRDRSMRYTDIDHWIEVAQILERGRFDCLFLADVLGLYDTYAGTPDAAIRRATQVPINDPLLIVSAMAAATQNLGFAVTANMSFDQPYTFARRMSTLDHVTKGRIGWNVVTGFLDSASRGVGRSGQNRHDLRYDIADDYMAACYLLWEDSWEDGAVVRDRAAAVFADPAKVHRIVHDGPHYRVDGVHLCEPSPQRTPLIFQAGASTRGREFAATHAECVFVDGPSRAVVGQRVTDLRRRAAAKGRNPADLLVFMGVSVVVGATERLARDRLDEYMSYSNVEGALALMSGWSGIDFSRYPRDQPIGYFETQVQQSMVEAITTADPSRQWTVEELARTCAFGGLSPIIAGSPRQVADQLQDWVAHTDVDGFNLSYIVSPESYGDFVDLVVPELQDRGVVQRDYAPGTIREKLFGAGCARLPAHHPGLRQRHGAARMTPAPSSGSHGCG